MAANLGHGQKVLPSMSRDWRALFKLMECSIKAPWGSCFPEIVDITEYCVYDGEHYGMASYYIGKANA